jgi:hypothetical protein
MKTLFLLSALLPGLLSAELPPTILTPAESAPILVDGLEFVVVTHAAWELQGNVLQLRITNRGDKPMLFPTFDSFYPLLTTADHTTVRLGGGRNKTRITPNILLLPGKGFTLSLDAKLEYQGPGKDGAFQYRDGTGTILTATLSSGIYSIAFDLCPTHGKSKHDENLTTHMWSGRGTTESVNFTVKYPQLPHDRVRKGS